jgi:hypothetical protein
MIYVIKTISDPAFIKVGYARKSLSGRIKSVKTGCPFELELIMAKNGGLKDERVLHKLLESHRSSGEWFHWNESTRSLLGLNERPKVINPDSPKTFLTPRQKQLNHLFRKGHQYQLYVHTLELFLKSNQYPLKDIREFPEHKARFTIFESTINEVFKELGSASSVIDSSKGPDDKQLFISALETPNWHEIYKSPDWPGRNLTTHINPEIDTI